MTGECGIVDVIDTKRLVKKCFDAVKYLSGGYGSGRRGGHGCGERCEGLGSDRYDGDLSFAGSGVVDNVLREEVEYLDMRLHCD